MGWGHGPVRFGAPGRGASGPRAYGRALHANSKSLACFSPIVWQMASSQTPESDSQIPTVVDAAVGGNALERRHRRLVVNRAFGAIKAKHSAERTLMQSVADRLNDFASSTLYFVLHVVWFVVWIPWNMGWLGVRPFDPYPFGLLTMIVSLEAIFLSIFVLMAQKRESAIAELREELMLQVNLRMEEEMTKMLQLVAGLYTRLGHRVAEDPELSDMMQPLDVAGIEHEVAAQIEGVSGRRRMWGRRGKRVAADAQPPAANVAAPRDYTDARPGSV